MIFRNKWRTLILSWLMSICIVYIFTMTTVVIGDIVNHDNEDSSLQSNPNDKSQSHKPSSVLGKCTRCKLMSNSFYENLKNISINENLDFRIDSSLLTDVQKFNRIKKNIHFTKILDKLCFDIRAGHADCRALALENEDVLFSWWQSDIIVDQFSGNNIIFNSLCIETLKFCCPDNHYGLNCLPCIGFPTEICSNNGKCAGTGTRLGNGHCICKKGYTGNDCSTCEKSFYLNKTTHELNGTIHCIACDSSCAETCFASGPRGCHVCKNGYTWDNEYGCYDVDECSPGYANLCPPNSFCINTDGSYQCYQCDHACNGCDGDGPDSCLKCADGHVLKEGSCVNTKPDPLSVPYASPARYVTYFGLCLVTCIIFRHNIFVASAIGLAVALYIMASERSLETEYGRAFDEWWNKVFATESTQSS